MLVTDPGDVDVVRFESLVERAHRLTSTDPARATVVFREATGLWRGPALDDLAEQPSLRPEIARLEESRLAAVEERIATELTLGRDRELVPQLESLVQHNPFRERFWGQLMTALYRSGRQGDALAVYQRARTVLLEELGIDPSPELKRLEQQILRQDADLEITGQPLRGYRLIERIGEGPCGVVSRPNSHTWGARWRSRWSTRSWRTTRTTSGGSSTRHGLSLVLSTRTPSRSTTIGGIRMGPISSCGSFTLTDEIPGEPGALTPVVDVAFSPDGETVATTTAQGGLIRTWDAATGARRLTLKDGSGNAVPGNWEIEFSPDGTLLAAPSGDVVYVWDSDTGGDRRSPAAPTPGR